MKNFLSSKAASLLAISFCSLYFTYGARATPAFEADESASDQPKLIVVVSVDQLRRDRLDDDFPGFLGRLKQEARVFDEATLDHGVSTTCAGHATILSGMSPAAAGIPGNSFIDHKTFEKRYCVDDDRDSALVIGGSEKRSPKNLKVSTFGAWLKSAHAGSRVFAVGGKDRAVITMAGHKADAVFWYDNSIGRFTTSGYYAPVLPDYLLAFNGDDPLQDGYLNKVSSLWEHDEGKFRADDYKGESTSLGRKSGHPLAKGKDAASIYKQIYQSPELDTQTIRLAKIVVEEEGLGLGETPDLLIIALSATDTVGHLYGPRSAEAEATLLNVDSQLSGLMDELEASLGKDNILFVLTADHGVAELPEYTTEKARNSCPKQGRISAVPLMLKAQLALYWHYTRPFNKPSALMKFSGGGFTFNREYIRNKGLDLGEIIGTMDEVISHYDIVKEVWTQAEIVSGQSEVAGLLRKSLTEENANDLYLQLHKGCVVTMDKGTTHGSVYDYDRNIPLMFYGWKVTPGHTSGKAHSVDIAPSLAVHLGIAMPSKLNGKALGLK